MSVSSWRATQRRNSASRFGRRPTVSRAPGRVNLIGEHTDYNEGFVMPAALEFATLVAASPRPRPAAQRLFDDHGRDARVRPRRAGRDGRHDWSDYVFGVAVMLERSGRRLKGADLVVSTDVPLGSGLSSSAALEVSSAHALLTASGLPFEPIAIAKICQRAENDYVGMRCGIMDQYVSACGVAGDALLIDCRTLESRNVPIAPNLRLLVANSIGAPSARGRRIQRKARSLRGGRAPAQARARADPGAARRDARKPSRPIAGFCPTSFIAAAATSSPRTPGCSRPSAR